MPALSTIARILLVALASILATAVPVLASASLPDPSWVPGAYDDDDYDDVVVLIASGTGNVAPTVLADLPSIPPLIGSLPQSAEWASLAFSASAVHPRAPPAS